MDLTASSRNLNKQLKQDFVSNLTGSSMLEIAALSTIVPALVVLRQWSCSSPVSGTICAKELEKKNDASLSRKDGRNCTVALIMDFLCVILPIALLFTMDLGVGSFIVANSLVSRQARGVKSMEWKSALQSICPQIFLGFARLISTTGVDYQVHVGGYGVHWNFFFTLAAVSILTSIVNIHPKYCGIFGLLILIGYQICLLCGLNEYLISNERASDLISQNKEGIFSIFGYWGMYLVGVHLGYLMFFGNESSPKAGSIVAWARVRVWILCIFLWSLTIILDNHVERVSRRMCNAAYVALVLAQNFQVLAIIMLSDFISGQKPLVLEEAFNQNLLGSFLLANLLTGMVNMSVDTLSAIYFAAIGIVLGYTFLLSAVVGLAWFYGIKFKFC